MRNMKKFFAVLLSIAILAISVLPSFAVDYPENISKQKVLDSMTDLDNLVLKLVSVSSEKNLSDTVYEMLCCDQTLNSLFSAVYGEMTENAGTLSAIGVNVSPANIAACLSNYPQVSAAIATCSDLKSAVALAPTLVWNVSDKDGFASACAAMFAPFENILYTLLCSGSVQINDIMSIQGADGYTTAIIPLFEALECPQIISQADFTANANSSRKNMILNIVSMLYLTVDSIAGTPVSGISSILPHLAYYLQSGSLSDSISKLLEPLSLKIGIFTIPGITSLFSGIESIENSDNLSDLLKNVDISEIAGSDMQLSLPEVDLEALAACGSLDASGKFVSDRADALVTIMQWLVKALKQNSSVLLAEIDENYADIIKTLLAKDDTELVKAVFVLLTAGQTPRNKMANYTYPEIQQTSVQMPDGLTVDNMETVVRGMDDLIEEIMKESDPDAELEETLKEVIYSNKVVAALMKGLYGALDGAEFSQIFDFLGISTSTASVAMSLKSYSSVSSVLRSASSWDNVDTEKLNFGFTDGSKEGFSKALTAILMPFEDVLSFLLASDTIKIADTFSIKGTNGYATVVIPILEAIGCDNQTIVAYSAYARTDGAVITDIINPILSLVDKICASPVEMLCSILPNIVYFLDSGLFPQMIKNLLYPVTCLLDEAGLSDLLPEDMFSEISDFNIDNLTKDLDLEELLGQKITLPEFKLSTLATLGTSEERISKTSGNGTSVSYTYIVADRPAVMITIMRFLVDTLSLKENSSLLSGFMQSGDSDDMMSMYAGNIVEKFSDMTTDEIIVWLYGLFFRETPDVEIDNTPEVIPTVIYNPDNSLTAGQIIGIIIGILFLALFVIWILLHLGYLEGLQLRIDKISRKREKKKREKQKKKQEIQMAKARNNKNVVYSSQLDGAGRKNMKVAQKKTDESGRVSKPAAKSPATSAAQLNEMKSAEKKSVAPKPVQMASRNPMHSEKESLKFEKQQLKAAKKAYKETKKADKYFEKALKESVKK